MEKYLDKIYYKQRLMFHPRDMGEEITLSYIAGQE